MLFESTKRVPDLADGWLAGKKGYATRAQPVLVRVLGMSSVAYGLTTLVLITFGLFLCDSLPQIARTTSWADRLMGSPPGFVALCFLIVLFAICVLRVTAGYHLLRRMPDGLRLHRKWAILSMTFSVAALWVTSGQASICWVGLATAFGVLVVVRLPWFVRIVAIVSGTKPRKAWSDEAF